VMKKMGIKTLLAVSFMAISLGACSTTGGVNSGDVINDPLEPMNRVVFGFNDVLDKVLIEPLAKGYKAVLPDVVQDSVQSFMRNIKTPLTLANNLLQGNFESAGRTTARFLMNTVLGVGGLNDFAASQGLQYEAADFGQTLARWGVESGPYLVLPILGPSTFRETAGLAVDTIADPVRIVTNNTDNDWIYYSRAALQGIDTRSRLIEVTDDLRANNLDYYTATKSTYIQNRMKMINDGRILDGKKSEAYMPNYDEVQ